MARTANGPRKTEFVGIPLDRKQKQRLKDAAKAAGTSHTEFARDGVLAAVEKVEKTVATSR